MSILKPGDRVRLPSGGPDMTIDRIIPVHCGSSIGYNVRCVWFVDGQYNSAIFSVDALEPVPDDQVPEPPTVRQPDPARRRSRGFD